jgi:sigma-B regulation protein RsbU (phosphoserine phosphatase)
MRSRVSGDDASPFAKARRDALREAEQVETRQILASVLALTERRGGEVPFALDDAGKIYAADPKDVPVLEGLSLRLAGDAQKTNLSDDWVVVLRKDQASGITLGIARPVGESLREAKRAAAVNLALGLVMAAAALLWILPLSRRMTRGLAELTEGASNLARGDLATRLPVRGEDEFGRLAATFNRMAEELNAHQGRLLERERLQKELDLCRRIQEELLPRSAVRFPFVEAEGISFPAREVGGDFFNYFPLSEGEAGVLVGDVSGKGIAAALLMANVQATLRARLPLEGDLVRLADRLDREIEGSRPSAVYFTMFMGALDGKSGLLRFVNAGHNPPILLRADGAVEPLAATGRPIGLFPGGGYTLGRAMLRPGDALFLYTDGVVEAEDARGDPFGLPRLEAILVRERTASATGLLARVEEELDRHRGAEEPADDATMVVVRLLPQAA